MTEVDKYVIQQVKAKRLALKLSQLTLSQKLGMSDSFISHVESDKKRAKYNLNHLNELAKIFECSPKDFLPELPI